MSYCTLEEAWGSDFKKKKKSKRDKKLERQEKNTLHDAVDPQILIPDTYRLADNRKIASDDIPMSSMSSIQGFDELNSYFSPYQSHSPQQVQQSNISILENQERHLPNPSSSLISNVEKPVDQLIKISKREYDNLQQRLVEGFGNQTDEQFNQLILFVFTGILYLFMLDMMYQLGKKSY